MLQIVDTQWKDHLCALDHLKEGIGLRGYGQRDPLVEYKKESFALFQDMKARIEEEMVRYLFRLRPVLNEEAPNVPRPVARRATPITMNNPAAEAVSAVRAAPAARRLPPGAARRPGQRAASGPDRRRRRDQDRPARGTEGRPQRSVPVRQREEVQEVPRTTSRVR